MIVQVKKKLVKVRNWLIFKYFSIIGSISNKKLPINKNANFVVSIASYPKRDHLLPAVFQNLSRQNTYPSKWMLILSEEEYLDGLPVHLFKLEKRGVEILWVKNNPFAVKKLVPVMSKYPNIDIVTLDDDFLYYKNLLKILVTGVENHPSCIIGVNGKMLFRKDDVLNMFYRTQEVASPRSNPESVYFMGGSGTYYPAGSLDKRCFDLDAIHKIVPGRGSDMWFWAAAHANGSKQVCVGEPKTYDFGIPIPENSQTKTREAPTHEELDERFQRVIDYFGIRERLLKVLPERGNNDKDF